MKLIVAFLGLYFTFSASADASVFNCDRAKFEKDGSSIFNEYGMLFVSSKDKKTVLFITADSEKELGELAQSDMNMSYYTYQVVEDSGKTVTYSSRDIEETKKSYESVRVLKVPASALEEVATDGSNAKVKLKIEDRDYDSDYSGWFFFWHKYVIRGSAEYNCIIKN